VRCSFVRQAANLWQYKELLQRRLATLLGAFEDNVHLIDGIPISLCRLTRASQCQSFQGTANYGYCATNNETYYGVYSHLLISGRGVITGFSLTSANGNEREALWNTVPPIQGLLIRDKGYLGQLLQQELRGQGINLQTALRSSMKDKRNRKWVQLLQ